MIKTMSIKKNLLLIFFIYFSFSAKAQELLGMGTRWNDSFVEWVLYGSEDGEDGVLQQRWAMQDNWTAWEYRFGERRGSIETKWKDDVSEWVVRGEDGSTVQMRLAWQGDMREWRISDHSHSISLRSRWGNQLNEWRVDSNDYGSWKMQAAWEKDPREWDIFDELGDELPFSMRMALAFVVVFVSSPKY
jgi:hypothetical protein